MAQRERNDVVHASHAFPAVMLAVAPWPAQLPLQPVKVPLELGVAVKVRTVPCATSHDAPAAQLAADTDADPGPLAEAVARMGMVAMKLREAVNPPESA